MHTKCYMVRVALCLAMHSARGFSPGPLRFSRPRALGIRPAGRGKKGNLKEVLTELGGPKINDAEEPSQVSSSQPRPARPLVGEETNAVDTTAVVPVDTGFGIPLETPHTAKAETEEPLPLSEVVQEDRSRDPITREYCYLPADEPSRMAVCFPKANGVTRSQHRLAWGPKLAWESVADSLAGAARCGNATMRSFTLANLDHLGDRARLLLTSLKMSAQFRKKAEEMETWRQARSLFLLAEFSLSTPFRQLMREAEQTVGRVVNDDGAVAALAQSLSPSGLAGCLLLLHAAVATWAGKDSFDNMALARVRAELEAAKKGGEKGVDQKLVMTLEGNLVQRESEAVRTSANLAMWTRMSSVLSAQPNLRAKLEAERPEVLFLDQALRLASDTDVRALLARDFCAPGGAGFKVGEASVREGARRLLRLATCLSPNNYGALAIRIADVCRAADDGASDCVDYYELASQSPRLHFETYAMPELPGMSAYRDVEESPFTPDKVKAEREAWKEVVKERPTDLDWYHKVGEPELPNEFMDRTVRDPIDEPEKWDSTDEIRDFQADIDKRYAADLAAGLEDEDTSLIDELARLASERDMDEMQRFVDELIKDMSELHPDQPYTTGYVTGFEEELEELAFDDAAMAAAFEDLMLELSDDEKLEAEAEAKAFLEKVEEAKRARQSPAGQQDEAKGAGGAKQGKAQTLAGDDEDDNRNMYSARI